MQELTEQELNIAYSEGVLEGALEKAPAPVKEALKEVIDGVAHYRDKYIAVQEDFQNLQARYNELTGLTAGYLQLIRQQKILLDEALIEQQRDLHKGQEPE